jgi:hypothetical protein
MKSHLLGFREEIIRVAIQRHLADALHRDDFLRNQLGGIQQVEIEFVFICFRNELDTQFPFREVPILDRFP